MKREMLLRGIQGMSGFGWAEEAVGFEIACSMFVIGDEDVAVLSTMGWRLGMKLGYRGPVTDPCAGKFRRVGP